eukprot:1745986-Alexandrium_andersonii.AAC.1
MHGVPPGRTPHAQVHREVDGHPRAGDRDVAEGDVGCLDFAKKPPTTDHEEAPRPEGPAADPGGRRARKLDRRLERKRCSALGGPKAAGGSAVRLALGEGKRVRPRMPGLDVLLLRDRQHRGCRP